jgi:hypothetical protein
VRVAVLVGVDEDQVEGALRRQAGQDFDGGADVDARVVGEAGPTEGLSAWWGSSSIVSS